LFTFSMGIMIGAAWHGWGCYPDYHGGNINIDNSTNINIDRPDKPGKPETRPSGGGKGTEQWKHNPEHRKGVPYKDEATAQKFNRGSSADAAKSREAYRGRTEPGVQDRSQAGDRTGGKATDRSNIERGGGNDAFSGRDRGSETKMQSDRGRSSQQSMSSRSGGAGSRGGGGRGGGGRR
jgi:hypothetical protein